MPNLCCCCAEEFPESRLAYLEFRYNVPGVEGEQASAVALVCPGCFKDGNDPCLFPVVESLINCNLIRVEHPTKVFTPEGWA